MGKGAVSGMGREVLEERHGVVGVEGSMGLTGLVNALRSGIWNLHGKL